MSVAVSNLTASSVQLALELAQTAGEGEVLQEETIGFIAMEQGSGNFRNLGRRLERLEWNEGPAQGRDPVLDPILSICGEVYLSMVL